MAGGTPGSSSRGRGGKFKKYTRGGGKHFSRDIRPLDADGNEVSIWSADARTKDDDSDSDSEEDSEDESSEEESDDDAGPSNSAAAAQAASREDRKAQKKARKEAAIARQNNRTVEVGDMPSSDEDESDDDDMPANPNHSKAARNQAKAAANNRDGGVDEVTEGVQNLSAAPSRREREALEAAAAKEKYMKLHAAGKTDEAKADLARLALIREQRAAEAARRKAEKDEREAQEKAKRAEFEAKEARKREAAAAIKKGKKK